MNLVIVESPAKAKTINKYLGSNYTVLASYGHIRDLPSKNGSVDPENKFKMIWEVDSFSKKYLKEITDTAKDSDKGMRLNEPANIDYDCPACSRQMQVRNGSTGVFLGCSGYALKPKERCKQTINLIR